MKLTQTLLEWVVTSAALILVVLALRALLGKRVSACLRYALWAVVLVRLLVPVQLFHLPFAGAVVFPETQIEETLPPVEISASGQSVGSPTIAAPVSDGVAEDHSALAAPNAPAVPSAPKAPDMTRTPAWLGWAWLAGSVAVALVLLACNLRFSQKLRRVRLPLEDADCSLPVYVAVGLPSPCLFGVVRPAVYVTPDAAANPILLRHVLVHEATHFHHGDHCWNVLRNIALAVHWWNPLVWLAVILSRRDCELACDEGALKRLDAGERIAYGRTLLALVTEKPRASDLFTCATTMTGDQKGVIERVTRIARAPKRWFWAAVVAVIVTALACVCAFGQAVESTAEEPLDLAADLTFSLSETDPLTVTIQGTIGEFTVSSGTSWHPVSAYDVDLLGNIFIPYPPFGGENGMISAWWTDESRTAVTITGQPLPMTTSGDDYTGWRTFTVSFDGNGGSITESHIHGSEENIYLAALSDKEAVTLACFAAKLLTVAEDYYNNHTADLPYLYTALLGGAPFYSVDVEKMLTFDTIAETLDPDGVGYEITRYASVDFDGDGAQELILYVEQQGAFNFILHDMDGEMYGYCCGVKPMQIIKTDGTFYNKYAAEYAAESDGLGGGYCKVSFTKTGLEFHPFTYEVNLPSREDGSDSNYRLVVDGQPADSQAFEAAVAAQDAKSDVTWHEFPEQDPAPTQPAIPVIDPGSYAFIMDDEYGVSVSITGLDCEYATWTSRSSIDIPGPSLDISEPRFLGEEFADVYSSVYARYSPEDDRLWMSTIENISDALGSREFLVDLITGAVTEQEVSILVWKGKLPVPSNQVLAIAAQTLAQLMQEASDFYQASLPAPEEGPLPFDVPMKMEFASGAGGWDTLITLHPDGSFEGSYHDMDMGDSGPGYQSTEYVCQFHGWFGEIRQVTGASWSLTLEELVLDTGHPIGEEWIEAIETGDGYTYNLRYISSDPYGFDAKDGGPLKPGAQFMLYTPDASGYRPTDELYGFNSANTDYDSVMYQFWTWMPSGHKIGAWGWDTKISLTGCRKGWRRTRKPRPATKPMKITY